MAKFTTTTFPTKPLLSRPKPLSLSSNLFGLRIHNPSSSNFKFLISRSHLSVSARYGGDGGGGAFTRPDPGYNRQSRQSDSDEDEALDLSIIRSDIVRLIDEKQNMVGIVPKSEALRMADDAELDLVILSLDADPPVVKLMDYNKYKYEQQKKKRDQQKKSAAHRMGLKELKMRYNIDVHDYTVRLKAALKFLKDRDKVKVIVSLKGREMHFRKNAVELLSRFQTDIGELATEESKVFRDKTMTLVMVPNKNYVQKTQELPKKKEDPVSAEAVSVQKAQELPEKKEDSVSAEQVSVQKAQELPDKKEYSVSTEVVSVQIAQELPNKKEDSVSAEQVSAGV